MTLFTFRDATAADRGAIIGVVYTVLAEYGLQPDPAETDRDLGDLPCGYLARGGMFRVLVTEGGEVVGCGGLYPWDDDEAEIRKMYFLPFARGHGLGRQLLRELIEEARRKRFKWVVLETASVLHEAIALYTNHGFVPAARPPHSSRCDRVFELELPK
ncbi:MAG: GNAT family N-acetyltransferase [Planctomycetota bacterium]